MQRSQVKLFCVAVCVSGMALCALNRAPILAAVHGIAAVAIWTARFGLALEFNRTDALIITLRDARAAEEAKPPAVRAMVTPSVITVPSLTRRWTDKNLIAFRDEMTADQWRHLTTALRHQPRRAATSMLVKKVSRT